jgi:hypothetical protein
VDGKFSEYQQCDCEVGEIFFRIPAVFVIILLEVHHQSAHQGMLEWLGKQQSAVILALLDIGQLLLSFSDNSYELKFYL